MRQKDFLIGNVGHVFDGETFKLMVTRVGRKNENEYDDEEKIHIQKLKPADILTYRGTRPKPLLERMLLDKEVMCLVHSREKDGHIDADVFII
ncbi:MAG: hypothetical protein GTN70_11795 [Deltaproteobacteria bacterium]|nr:hypothetical protein [Deltaproteobacteria bacterium]NIS78455.1 hypothetical protein [Deltaproteobacteria bacterium]